ncbi:hypothetical protein DPEC_G00177640 [Dallia pectoralis]|uniref:Uncharacterized protein n=1 Tax=Dallia pectoralis TaxID=75939 RepID=A0ACC2GEY2_DALPE|nr:hypothetical protein DPEC_G00177640 [Dallia pectoralis]
MASTSGVLREEGQEVLVSQTGVKAAVIGLLVLPSGLTFTVIVEKILLQHILVNDEHRFLYYHVSKVAYTDWKRVFKVLSGTLDKVNIKKDHKRNLLFLST